MADAMRRVLRDPEPYQRQTGVGLERYSRAAYVQNYRKFIEQTALGKSG